MFTFFTEVLKQDVVDRHGCWVGRPVDFLAKLDEPYPRFTHLIVRRGRFRRKYYTIPWSDVQSSEQKFQLRTALQSLTAVEDHEKLPTLARSILDQQVVDTYNRKVVRVNDLQFLSVRDELRLVHVDVGVRGLVRRLGWENWLDGLVRIVRPHASYLTDRGFISWKYIQPLSIQDAKGGIKLNVEQDALEDIPPADISEMLMELDPYQRPALLKMLDVQTQVDIITELELKWQKDLIEDLDRKTAVELFEQMPADEATDLLQEFSKRDANHFIARISTRKAREIRELMEHETDSAGGIMTTEFVTLTKEMNVGEAIELVRQQGASAETIHCSYVVNENKRLIGSVLIRELLLEPNPVKIEDVMHKKPPDVNVDDSVKEVAFTFDKYNHFVLPVTNDDGVIEGIITIDDVLSHAVEEAWGERTGL